MKERSVEGGWWEESHMAGKGIRHEMRGIEAREEEMGVGWVEGDIEDEELHRNKGHLQSSWSVVLQQGHG